jgi:hypothetical protein
VNTQERRLRGTVVAIAAVMVAVLAAGLSAPAYGDDDQSPPTTVAGGCYISPYGYEVCDVGGGGNPGPGETTTPGPTGSGPPTTASPYYDDYELASTYFNDGNNYVCDAEGNHETLPMGEPLPRGYVELDVVLEKSTATGQVVNTWLQCEAEPTPTTLPPPTPEESWAAADTLLPSPTIQFSPSDNGLVHLQTWFWLSNDAAGAPVTVTARTDTGQTITAVVEPVGYTWTFGTGDSAPSSTAGSEEDPAVRYTYVDAGTYEVSVTVEWAGQYYGPGGDEEGALGPVAAPATYAPYQVRQIRSVLSAGTG